LYLMVEAVDETFAAKHLGSKKAPIFKPVTYKLFEDLGENWAAYADTYDLKTEATAEQEQRVIEFARLVSHAEDGEFAARVGEFLDLEAFAKFLAGQVILSNYDSILSNGQNFYLYLDPRANKFGFIPWDLDLAWGAFFLLATTEERERASIWHPWVGENRFIERVMKVEEVRELYRAALENQLAQQFIPERLCARIDQVAAVLRDPITAESDYRRKKFEEAIASEWHEKPPRRGSGGENRPVHQLKRFIHKRAHAVRDQLDGKNKGMILRRQS
jgi:spore coat protein H